MDLLEWNVELEKLKTGLVVVVVVAVVVARDLQQDNFAAAVACSDL